MKMSFLPTTPMNSGMGWKASLNLSFASRFNKTYLVERKHKGPLRVQRPFYPEGAVCHVYLLHPPGGVVGGDDLAINVNAAESSHALLTTPAAGKFYRSDGVWANQAINIVIDENAIIEWLPQETIVYEGAHLKARVKVELAKAARFIGWEILSLGRPASGEGFATGAVDLTWQINEDGKAILLERLRLDAEAFAANWGMQGYSSCGMILAKPASLQNLTSVQEFIGEAPNCGVTLIDDMLICRALDERSDRLRAFFEEVWRIVRLDILQRDCCSPRVWAT